MTRQVVDGEAEIRIWPAISPTGTPFLTIPSDDIESASFTHQLAPQRSLGNVRIDDRDADYRDDGAIELNSRVELWLKLLGQGAKRRRFTGKVTKVDPTITADQRQVLELQLEDWVTGILGDRTVADGFTDAPISGSSDAIINSIVSAEAPEIELRSATIDTIPATYSARWDYGNLLEAVQEAADLEGAIVGSRGTQLVVSDRTSFYPTLLLDEHDIQLPADLPTTDKSYANRIIVRGGRGVRQTLTQSTVDAYVAATDSSRITTQITGYNYESVPQVDVWTRLIVLSGDDLVVRVQPDSGGSPEAVADRSADLGRASLGNDQLENDGWSTFEVGATGVPDTFWLIVEASGSDGHEVGFDDQDSDSAWDSGEPIAYRVYQSYPTTEIVNNAEKVDVHGRVDKRVRAQSTTNATKASDIAESTLDRSETPRRSAEFDAASADAHGLRVLEAVGLEIPYLDPDAETYVVTRREQEFEANQLSTSFQIARLKSL